MSQGPVLEPALREARWAPAGSAAPEMSLP